MQAASSMRIILSSTGTRRCYGARRSFAGRQLHAAVQNGSRCHAFFKFGGNKSTSNEPEFGARRDDYTDNEVKEYFMYMGMLASEGNYDRCEAMLASGTHPVDLLLLMACQEGDDGKVEQLLQAGADANVKDSEGRTPMDLAKKEEVKELLQKYAVAA